jgi:hypothetical protein
MTGPDELALEQLTDKQFDLVCRARPYPVILKTRGEAITAASLERRGWGTVENGASSERIFRINQAGDDACAWLDVLGPDA